MQHFLRMMTLSVLILFALTGNAQSNPHGSHHVRHNMVLYGLANQFYVSHVVFKSPHNYQVILQVSFAHEVEKVIETSKFEKPKSPLFLVLNAVDIRELQNSKPELTGIIVRDEADGTRTVLANDVQVVHYNLIFFSEVPLSLEPMSW